MPGKNNKKAKGGSSQTKAAAAKLNWAEAATAPYDFVSLPDKVLPSPLDENRKFLQSGKGLSGVIELDMEALTPIFIGKDAESADFFSPAGKPIIPGSTIRGMVRNLLKIISCGSMEGKEDLNARHIYYRCIMAPKQGPEWMGDLHDLYAKRMQKKVGPNKNVSQADTGFLVKTRNGKYYLAPALPDSPAGRHNDRMLIYEYENTYHEQIAMNAASVKSEIRWHGKRAFIITGSQKRSALVESKEEFAGMSQGDLRHIGKQYVRYIDLDDADWERQIPVPEDVIEGYIEDTTRRGVNLLVGEVDKPKDEEKNTMHLSRAAAVKLGINLLPDVEWVIPCGYLIEGKQISAIGHGLCFRIPYKHGIMDAVPALLQDGTIDFAAAMFGSKEKWRSRLSFEDGIPVGAVEQLPSGMAHPLLQPNPTSYQLYLKQEPGAKLKHWDSPGTQIRGYKLYWHDKASDWKATAEEKKLTNVVRPITPLAKGSRFQARIRFQDLSKEELGALLMVFDMGGHQKRTAYKLGQGKSLGLGSVRILPTLKLDTPAVYQTFFSEGRLSDSSQESDGKEYLDAFQQYIEDNGLTLCWGNIMGELQMMLDWTNADRHPQWEKNVMPMRGKLTSKKGRPGEFDFSPNEGFKQRLPLATVKMVYDHKEGGDN